MWMSVAVFWAARADPGLGRLCCHSVVGCPIRCCHCERSDPVRALVRYFREIASLRSQWQRWPGAEQSGSPQAWLHEVVTMDIATTLDDDVAARVATLVPWMQQRAAQLDAAAEFPVEEIAALHAAGALG